MFIAIFGIVVLAFCWYAGDQQLSTKLIFTLLYFASLALLLWPQHEYLFIVAQCIFVGVVGASTFGLDWLKRNVR
jgi:hypothetical protein